MQVIQSGFYELCQDDSTDDNSIALYLRKEIECPICNEKYTYFNFEQHSKGCAKALAEQHKASCEKTQLQDPHPKLTKKEEQEFAQFKKQYDEHKLTDNELTEFASLRERYKMSEKFLLNKADKKAIHWAYEQPPEGWAFIDYEEAAKIKDALKQVMEFLNLPMIDSGQQEESFEERLEGDLGELLRDWSVSENTIQSLTSSFGEYALETVGEFDWWLTTRAGWPELRDDSTQLNAPKPSVLKEDSEATKKIEAAITKVADWRRIEQMRRGRYAKKSAANAVSAGGRTLLPHRIPLNRKAPEWVKLLLSEGLIYSSVEPPPPPKDISRCEDRVHDVCGFRSLTFEMRINNLLNFANEGAWGKIWSLLEGKDTDAEQYQLAVKKVMNKAVVDLRLSLKAEGTDLEKKGARKHIADFLRDTCEPAHITFNRALALVNQAEGGVPSDISQSALLVRGAAENPEPLAFFKYFPKCKIVLRKFLQLVLVAFV
jgi:hypothetical protein